uniref:C2H2-type domain-containing protein n=1 Tax=Heliothis virescens TaxID=7102 RepID=A0A2A4JK25_HELVI
MNKKPVRTGPRIRITRPALNLLKTRKIDDPVAIFDDRKYIYSCQYCRLKFTQNSQYFRHMTSNHEIQQKAATFECNDCQIVFSKKSNLDLHCQTHHQIKSKSKCESCAITFKSRYCLRRHLKLKQILQENSCFKCQKKFTSKEGLAKHVKNKHTFKNVTFQCDLCSLKFKAEESLRSHLGRIHKKL